MSLIDGGLVGCCGGSSGGGTVGVPAFPMLADTSATNATGIGTGDVRWNNATQASATSIFIFGTDNDGANNQTSNLEYPEVGDTLFIKASADPTVYQKWAISSITDNTTYVTYGVTLDDSNGGNIADATAINVGFDLTVSAYAMEKVGNGYIGGVKTTDAGAALASLGTDSITIISGASVSDMKATGANSVVIGHDVKAESTNSVVLGDTSVSRGASDVVIGLNASSLGTGNNYNIVMGELATCGASASSSVVLGYSAESGSDSGIALGKHSHASGLYSIRMGADTGTSDAAGDYSIIAGYNVQSTASGDYCVALGKDISANGVNNIYIGNAAVTPSGGDDNILIGTGANSTGTFDDTIALGNGATVGATSANALGLSAVCNASNAWQFGAGTNSTANTAKFANEALILDDPSAVLSDVKFAKAIDNTTAQSGTVYQSAIVAVTDIVDGNTTGATTIAEAATGYKISPNWIKIKALSGTFATDIIVNIGTTLSTTKYASALSVFGAAPTAGTVVKVDISDPDDVADLVVNITTGSGAGSGKIRYTTSFEEMENE